jgi:hypothetical protein
MSNENAGRTGGRTNGAAPMGSTVAIVVTLVALVLGFLILRKVNDGGDSATVKPSVTTVAPGTTVDPTVTVPVVTEAPVTTVLAVTTGSKVQVANASSIDGAAARMSTAIGGKGYDMAEPVSASEKLEVSKVLYNPDDPAALPVATSLAALFGGIEIVSQGIPVPVASGNWAEGSGVVLMLGNDSAGKTLAEVGGAPVTGVTVAATTTTA